MNRCNCCDGIYNSLDVHFTDLCDNKCKHCIDLKYKGVGCKKPNIDAIASKILENRIGVDDVLFLGGEPCLFLDELIECIEEIKMHSALKIFVTTAVPKICHDKREEFERLLELVDGINLSVQSHNEIIADDIRNVGPSQFDRQAFYKSLPYKEKIRINLNIVKPFLYTKEDLTDCLKHYDKMGFASMKLSEIQHGKDSFVSFEKTFDMKMKSPYAHGCQKYIELDDINTPVLLKRSCFACEETLKASFADGVKVIQKMFVSAKNRYGIVYGDGTLTKGWV